MKNLRTIILAAGKGTRMKSKTPKVLHEIYGKALIDYVLDALRPAGSSRICAVLGHRHDMVRKHLGSAVTCVTQKRLLGTADAVRCARPFLRGYRGDILIVCGDTPLLRQETVRQLIRSHRRTNAACTFLTAMVSDSTGYGRVVRDHTGNVTAICEESDAGDDEKAILEINTGVYCFQNRWLYQALEEIPLNKKKKEFYLTDIVAILSRQGRRIETVQVPDANEGLGVNSREDLAYSAAVIRRRILQLFMQQGVTIIDPATTHIAPDVKVGCDTVIHPFTVIEKDVRIGANCRIGPFARLRPGTRIGRNVEVGNFAEVSRSQLGDRSLMKHFSFLGDAHVGAGVNIGAGVVTANYDGKNKNKTFIGKGAFVGSDSILVAPVWIGEKAVTGAGCVVTKGKRVGAGKVVAGVPARLIRKK